MTKCDTEIFLRLPKELKEKFKKMKKERGFGYLHQYLEYLLNNDEVNELSQTQINVLDKMHLMISSLNENFSQLKDEIEYLKRVVENSIIFSKDLEKISGVING